MGLTPHGVGPLLFTEEYMKSGEAVYLHQQPELRGNISRVTPEGVYVTWHKYVSDVPECLTKDSKVNIALASRRMRVFYPKGEMTNLGVGRPPLG